MNISSFSFIKMCTFILANFLLSDFVIGADYGDNRDNVLLIGRPEQGGVNLEQALHPFSKTQEDSVYYLDPHSQGNSSIIEMFPCSIPQDKPQQFGIVCIEKGMLNEVVTFASSHSGSELEPAKFTKDDEANLKALNEERREIWESYDRLKQEQSNCETLIVEKALKNGLIKEPFDLKEIYEKIAKERRSFCSQSIIPILFDLKTSVGLDSIASELEEFRHRDQAIDVEREKMIAKDKLIDPLEKLQYKETSQAVCLSSPLDDLSVASNVYRHIQSFVSTAWDLVCPGGTMVIFSADAKIQQTALADGISKEFLLSTLALVSVEMEECYFHGQAYEGERYFSNPALPAKINAFDWTGPRSAGSYFLIKKPQ